MGLLDGRRVGLCCGCLVGLRNGWSIGWLVGWLARWCAIGLTSGEEIWLAWAAGWDGRSAASVELAAVAKTVHEMASSQVAH